MNKTLLLTIAIMAVLVGSSQFAKAQQGVSVNTTGDPADVSAMFDISSSTKGVLVPRMLSTDRTGIATPAAGLLVYQTDAPVGFYFYNGTAWQLLSALSTAGVVPPANGGTGVINANTITVGGDVAIGGKLTTTASNDLTLTTTGITDVTLPTSGTLVNTDVTDLTKLQNAGTDAAGNVTVGNATGNNTTIIQSGSTNGGTNITSGAGGVNINGDNGNATFINNGASGGAVSIGGPTNVGQIAIQSANLIGLAGSSMSIDATAGNIELISTGGLIKLNDLTIGTGTGTIDVQGSTTLTSKGGNVTLNGNAGGSDVTLPADGTLVSSTTSAGGDLDGNYPAPTIGVGKVVEDRIGSGAVTNDKIGAGAVDAAKLATDAVETGKIKDGAVTTDKMSAVGSAGTYGSGTQVPVITVDASGRISGITPTAITATTNADMTGPITSTGNVTSVTAQTGTGTTFVMDQSPTITTPVISGHPTIEGVTPTGATGTGDMVFSNSPTFTTPNIGTATGSVSGNAGTATALQTARTINGQSFDGTANITVTAAAGTLTGATLASGVTTSSLTSFGASIALGTPASGNLTNCTFPTLNQNTSGSAAKWTSARTLAGNSVDGSANVAFTNKFIVQGTADAGLTGAQFLGALATGIVKNTTTTGALTIAVAGDFPTLNQNTTGSAAKLTTARTINGTSFDGSADITVTAAAGTLTGATLASGVTASSLTSFGASIALGTPASGTLTNCTFPTLNQNTTGSAAKLTTARAINGTNFDGSADITVTAAAGTLTGATLAAGVTASSLTSFGSSPTLTTPNIGAATGTSLAATGKISSSSASAGIGYTTGSGGTVTQTTSKSNGVTLNTITGQITMNNASLANTTAVEFTLTNSTIAATDVIVVNIKSGASANLYLPYVAQVSAGSCKIGILHLTGGALSEAVVLQYAVIKGSNN